METTDERERVRPDAAGSDGESAEAPRPPPHVVAAAAKADASVAGGRGIDGGAGVGGVDGIGEAQQAGQGLGQELTDLGGLLVLVLSQSRPWVAEVWKPDVVRSVAEAAAAVCAKHGWLAGGVQGGPEFALGISLIGPVMATVQHMRQGVQDGGPTD